jgi:hypothetical protein
MSSETQDILNNVASHSANAPIAREIFRVVTIVHQQDAAVAGIFC